MEGRAADVAASWTPPFASMVQSAARRSPKPLIPVRVRIGVRTEFDFLSRLKAGDSYPASLMGHRSSAGSRFTGDRVATGHGQPPSHIASTGV